MNIIYILIIALVLFFTKNIWGKYIVELFYKIKGKEKTVIPMEKRSVFSPVGTKRTFYIGVDIEENGDGTVSISLAKLKEK
jgi:hypothetical protein